MKLSKIFKRPQALNKNVFLWALYDFANTPLTVAMGGLYLAQWVVLDNGIDDIWYGGVFTASTVLLLITSPFLGAWSDKAGRRMPFLKWTTYIFILLGAVLGLAAVSPIAKITRVTIVLALFFFMQYIYQISLVFYNALLKSISKIGTRGRISGIGEVFGELGWLLGPAMLLPFATGMVTLFGETGRGQVFLPATFVLVILGLPMIFWLKEPKNKISGQAVNAKAIYTETIRGIKALIKENKNVTVFLVAFMFVSDALLTANLYFAIFLDQIFKISDFQKVLALALMEVFAITSASIIGRISDRHGMKKFLIISCANLTLIYLLMGLTSSLTLLYVLAALVGLGYGGFYTTSRALLIKISPVSKIGEYFGFYSTFQKFASIIGPLTWGGITLLLKDYGAIRYRAAVMALSLLMLIGTLLMLQVKEKRIYEINQETN